MSSELSSTSKARCRPISRGRRAMGPPPATRPTPTSHCDRRVFSRLAKLMSQASAISLPLPVARPRIRAIDTTGMRVMRTRMSGQASSPVGPCGRLVRSLRLARKSLWFRKNPSTALSKTRTLISLSASTSVMISPSSRTNCGPITFKGGLSNVTRQWAADGRVSRICGLSAFAFMEASRRRSCSGRSRSPRRRGGPRLLLHGSQQRLRRWTGGVGILSGDQEAVADHVRHPVGLLGEGRPELEHLVFDQERHDLGETDLFLLAIGEAGHLLALDQQLAFGRLDVMQRAGGMADDADRLAGGNEGLDQLDGIPVFGEVPHRTMPARIEQRVEILLPDAVETKGLVQLGFGGRILLEANGQIGAEFGFVALGVERRPAALR